MLAPEGHTGLAFIAQKEGKVMWEVVTLGGRNSCHKQQKDMPCAIHYDVTHTSIFDLAQNSSSRDVTIFNKLVPNK
jgi:hypothetical protein